jgi:hypothetical protein
MAKSQANDNSSQSSGVVSPTQAQMDEWVNEELADDEKMLADEVGTTFPEESQEQTK